MKLTRIKAIENQCRPYKTNLQGITKYKRQLPYPLRIAKLGVTKF